VVIVSEVDRYVIVINLLDSGFNIRMEPNCHTGNTVEHKGLFFRKAVYSTCDVHTGFKQITRESLMQLQENSVRNKLCKICN
jgi:hypothetical protein